MRSFRHLMLASIAFVLAGCATSSMTTGSHCAVEPGFLNTETTFTWRAGEAVRLDDTTGYASPAIVAALGDAVRAQMEAKGFRFVEPTADIAASPVELAVALRIRRELHSMTVAESPCEHTDCWERIDPGSSVRMDVRTLGFLAADVFYQGEPIWRGWVERTLHVDDRDNAAPLISEAVPALLAEFPP